MIINRIVTNAIPVGRHLYVHIIYIADIMVKIIRKETSYMQVNAVRTNYMS